MCGLAGIWRDQGHADPAALTRMLASILHRGPDDSGIWHKGNIALGHQRLTVLDLTDRAHQPMTTPAGDGVLIYNGEVYNYAELRAALQREGVTFSSTGDTEVVLAALHHWGPERAIPRFNGMFALAYADLRDGALWLARDALGIKPLNVAEIDGGLVFASEAKALMAHPDVEARVSPGNLSAAIMRRRNRTHYSLFHGVNGVEAGQWWKITPGNIGRHTWFDLPERLDPARIMAAATTTPDAMVDAVHDAVRDAVELHMVSDVPVATMCSGGVDSSLVTAFAREHRPDLTAYVADMPWEGGEAAQAELAGRHLGVPVNRVRVDKKRFLKLWPCAVWHHEGVPQHSSLVALMAVADECRKDGIKVLLTGGEGADELFGGYFWQDVTFRRWRRLRWPYRLFSSSSRKRTLARLHLAPFFSMDSYREPDVRRRMIAAFDTDAQMFGRRLMEHMQAVEPVEDRAFLAHCMADMHGHMAGLLVRHDRMGMAASIEMRVPFLENGLFDLAFHLPRRAKLHRGIGKWALKEAALRHLPRAITHARKKGFPMPDDFTRGVESLLLGGLLADHMGWSSTATREVADFAKVDAQLRFQLVGLELWLQLYFGEASQDALAGRLVEAAA